LINLAVSSSSLASIRNAALAVALGINAAAVLVSMVTAWALMREAARKRRFGKRSEGAQDARHVCLIYTN
jgi:hypothetical protein